MQNDCILLILGSFTSCIEKFSIQRSSRVNSFSDLEIPSTIDKFHVSTLKL